jgi:hypothetical protein
MFVQFKSFGAARGTKGPLARTAGHASGLDSASAQVAIMMAPCRRLPVHGAVAVARAPAGPGPATGLGSCRGPRHPAMALGLRAASVSAAAAAAGPEALGRQNSPADIKDAGRVQARRLLSDTPVSVPRRSGRTGPGLLPGAVGPALP